MAAEVSGTKLQTVMRDFKDTEKKQAMQPYRARVSMAIVPGAI